MDAPRQTFRCGPRWWLALLLALFYLFNTVYFAYPWLSSDVSAAVAQPYPHDRFLVVNGLLAIIFAAGSLAFFVVALLRIVRPNEVVLEEQAVLVPRYPRVADVQSIPYDAINDVQITRRQFAPLLTIYHTDGIAQVLGSRFRRSVLESLYTELGARVRAACAAEALK